MFTGLYANIALRGWKLTEEATLAQLFSRAGYRTAGFTNNPQINAYRGFGAGFDTFRVRADADDDAVLHAGLRWLKSKHESPFLLWIHLLDPHTPWLRNPEAQHLYKPGYRGAFESKVPGLITILGPARLARAKSLYEGEIFASDRRFGRLWRELQALQLDERVAVVITSDHGEELMEHGRLQHGQLTEEDLHVPLIVHLPGKGMARRVSTRVSTIDLTPTILALAGLPIPPHLTGRNLLAVPLPERPIVSLAVTQPKEPEASIHQGDEKLILHCSGPRRHTLYDLALDPDERNDLSEARPQRAHALEGALFAALDARGCDPTHVACTPQPLRGSTCSDLPLVVEHDAALEFDGLSEDDIRALKALGYLEDEG